MNTVSTARFFLPPAAAIRNAITRSLVGQVMYQARPESPDNRVMNQVREDIRSKFRKGVIPPAIQINYVTIGNGASIGNRASIGKIIANAIQIKALFVPQQNGGPRNLRMREEALMLAKLNREYLASKKRRPDVYQHSLRDHRIGEVNCA